MEASEIASILGKFSLFSGMTKEELRKIVDICIVREWKKGNIIFMQGDPLENVYFIKEGRVKIYKADIHGKEQIVAILKNGEMFPHVGFFRSGGYPAYSEVIEDAAAIVVPIQKFEEVLIQNPQLSIKIFKVLGEKIVDLQDRLEEQILNNTYEQIIKLLIRLSKSDGSKQDDKKYLLHGKYTNKDLANMIGTTRETVSRTLTKLKKNELIEVSADGGYLIDPDKLLQHLYG